MISVQVNNRIKFPKELVLQKELEYIAERIFVPKLSEGIHKQVSITGGKFPNLEPKTLERKSGNISKRIFTKSGRIREKASKQIESTGFSGFVNKTLIETGKLVSSFRFKKLGRDKVVVFIANARNDIAKYLQVDGVGRKRKKFLFFGISKEMERLAINYIRKVIDQKVKNA